MRTHCAPLQSDRKRKPTEPGELPRPLSLPSLTLSLTHSPSPSPSLGWFDIDDDHNTNVYVSNLPLDTTMEEFHTLVKKCGIVMEDDDGKTNQLHTNLNYPYYSDHCSTHYSTHSTALLRVP